jgi:tRNA threonylcarbamoyladenosine biosynthesis protein TsaE
MLYRSSSSDQTKKIAAETALRISGAKLPPKAILLSGDLGAGKTTFIQGFLKALGARGPFTSPTFVIMKKYRTKIGNVYHADLYRVRSAGELKPLKFREALSEKGSLMLIEWPERIRGIFPKGSLRIRFKHGKTEHERTIQIS